MRYHESVHTRYLSSEKVPGGQERRLGEFRYLDLHTARMCPRWFREAGLSDLHLQFTVEEFEFEGSESMVPQLTLVPPREMPDDPLWEVYRDMIAEGFIDAAAIDEASEQVASWYSNPEAFNLVGLLFVAGRAN